MNCLKIVHEVKIGEKGALKNNKRLPYPKEKKNTGEI